VSRLALLRDVGRRASAFREDLGARALGAMRVLAFDPAATTSLALVLDEWAAVAPERVALRFEGKDWSYGELRRRVIARARGLGHAGVERGEAVAVFAPNHAELVVDILALNWLGAIPALVNTGLVAGALRHAVRVASPRVAIVDATLLEAWREAMAEADAPKLEVTLLAAREGERLSPMGDERLLEEAELTSADEAPPPVALVSGTDTFAYIYTSGTTGLPKAGRVIHARAVSAGTGFGLYAMGLGKDDGIYICLPLFHSSGLLVGVASALVAGATIILARKFSARRFWTEVAESRATAFCYIGEICRYLLAAPSHPDERRHQVRRIVGNGMRPDVWRPFQERFGIELVHEFYGATEGNVNMINVVGKEGSCGRMPPVPGYDNTFLARFDHDRQMPARDRKGRCIPCRPGEVGELLGRIDESKVMTRFDGYASKEDTEKKILRDVEKKGDAFFRSGDLMKRDWLGFYYFVDRIGDTFRWKGENVSTNEVAEVCSRFPGVETANVYGVQVPGADGRAGMIALALGEKGVFRPETFYAHVDSSLPAYARPAFVRLVTATSLTATFKLKKNELQAEGFDPRKTSDLLFYRDDARRSYEPLDAAAHERVLRGALRF
jgi:fatty-acyl-CoA synthase